MARKWSNLNLEGALHYVTGNYGQGLLLVKLSLLSLLVLDHDWWWPDDPEKLSKAMKDLGWYSFWRRKGDI